MSSIIPKTVIEQSTKFLRSIGSPEHRVSDPIVRIDEFFGEGGIERPYRGIDVVTYLLSGKIQFEDSLGHKATLNEGDVQWMTTGRGLISSFNCPPPSPFQVSPSVAHGIQIWISLPKASKFISPRYQEFKSDQIATYETEFSRVKVVVGEYGGVKGQIESITPVTILIVELDSGDFEFESLEGFTTVLLSISGSLSFGSEVVAKHNSLVFNDPQKITVTGEKVKFMIVSAQKIGEPIVQNGPFVMSSQKEIVQSLMDLQIGVNGFESAVNWNGSGINAGR